jgi:hypothetical protein
MHLAGFWQIRPGEVLLRRLAFMGWQGRQPQLRVGGDDVRAASRAGEFLSSFFGGDLQWAVAKGTRKGQASFAVVALYIVSPMAHHGCETADFRFVSIS